MSEPENGVKAGKEDLARRMMFQAANVLVSPAWIKFMEFCKKIGHGEIEKIKIADGVPVLAEKVTEKTKFA